MQFSNLQLVQDSTFLNYRGLSTQFAPIAGTHNITSQELSPYIYQPIQNTTLSAPPFVSSHFSQIVNSLPEFSIPESDNTLPSVPPLHIQTISENIKKMEQELKKFEEAKEYTVDDLSFLFDQDDLNPFDLSLIPKLPIAKIPRKNKSRNVFNDDVKSSKDLQQKIAAIIKGLTQSLSNKRLGWVKDVTIKNSKAAYVNHAMNLCELMEKSGRYPLKSKTYEKVIEILNKTQNLDTTLNLNESIIKIQEIAKSFYPKERQNLMQSLHF